MSNEPLAGCAPAERFDLAAVCDGQVCVVASRMAPLGRPFTPTVEAALHEDLVALAARLATPGRVVVAIRELVGPYGVADLAALVTTTGRLRERAEAQVPPLLRMDDAQLVDALDPTAARSFEEVLAAIRGSRESLARRIQVLGHRRVVHGTWDGHLTRHPALTPLGELHAFEAKVRDWRGGVRQAFQYRGWADTATLVLARTPRDRGELDGQVARWKLGLAVGRSWHRTPEPTGHPGWLRLWASEFAAAALFGLRRELITLPPRRADTEPDPRQPSLPFGDAVGEGW
jgi:hypothetical protein